MPEEIKETTEQPGSLPRPERGDALRFENSEFATPALRPSFHGPLATSVPDPYRIPPISETALPSSLESPVPYFVTPALTPDRMRRLARIATSVALPHLWTETVAGMNTLTVRVDGSPDFEIPLDGEEFRDSPHVTGKLIAAVRKALSIALEHIVALEKSHEPGTVEHELHRIAFRLVNVARMSDVAIPTEGSPEEVAK